MFNTKHVKQNVEHSHCGCGHLQRSQDEEEKITFLQELKDIRMLCNEPWLTAGDFNMIYQASDKNNDNLDRDMMGRFQRFLNKFDLKEIPLLGRKYTWSNERSSPTLVRLDRAFCCLEWENIFPDLVLQCSASNVSDSWFKTPN